MVVTTMVAVKTHECTRAQETAVGRAVVETGRWPVGFQAAPQEAEVGDAPVVGVGGAGPWA